MYMERRSTSSTAEKLKALYMDLGRMGYREAWDIQHSIHARRVRDEIPDVLLLVEHEHVITLGKNAGTDNLKYSEAELNRLGVELYRIERGGDVTYHGPGQLVGYPIFKLRGTLAGIKRFIRNMELSLIKAMASFGIKAEISEGYPGIWVGRDKLAAIGVAVKRWVAFHGFALNVNTDLSYFDLIVPCGLKDRGVTSMEKILGRRVEMDRAKGEVIRAFSEVYNMEFSAARAEELI